MEQLQIIQNKIYEIRGQRVMLDFDLAELYGTETRVLKQAVKRNIQRFEGEDFMFQLTKEEVSMFSRSQFVTLKTGRGHNFKYMPFAFTELGVAMLSILENCLAENKKEISSDYRFLTANRQFLRKLSVGIGIFIERH